MFQENGAHPSRFAQGDQLYCSTFNSRVLAPRGVRYHKLGSKNCCGYVMVYRFIEEIFFNSIPNQVSGKL